MIGIDLGKAVCASSLRSSSAGGPVPQQADADVFPALSVENALHGNFLTPAAAHIFGLLRWKPWTGCAANRSVDVSALRALFYERGHVLPVGMSHLARMTPFVPDKTSKLHALTREECLDLLVQIAEKTAHITERT